jgi:hypothetical protein
MHRTTHRLYADAFAADPKCADDLRQTSRRNAACSAVLVSAGEGVDAGNPDEKEKQKCREQARLWLDAQYKQYAALLEQPAPQIWLKIRSELEGWQRDDDLASVRDDAINQLPLGEQEAWRQLWKDIAGTLKKAREKTAGEQKPQKNP